jgi:cell wall-associated NlpC family hydrolase
MSLDARRNAFRPDLADARLRGVVEATRFAVGEPRVVVGPSTALRRRPGPDAPLDSEALHGERVTVFESRVDGWSWVQLCGDQYVGYIETTALGEIGPAPTHRVVVPRSFVYPRADVKAPPVSWLPMGAVFAARPHDERFVECDAGGFVIARHVAPLGAPAADFVAVAESFIGVPYLWGGKTGCGLDCSGLVQVALDAAGRSAPRDSDMQERELGAAVNDYAALRRGDLVFWKGHVGVMRDAETLLHANGHHMLVASEPLVEATTRIAARDAGPITAIKRL